MSKHEKILKELLTRSQKFSYNELKKLLTSFGYIKIKTGKTSGSCVVFYNSETQHIIRLYKPHPRNILKRYQMDLITKELKNMEIIK